MLTIKNELKLSDKIKMVRVDDLWHMLILMMAWIPGKIYKFLHGDVWVITEYPENARDNGVPFSSNLLKCLPSALFSP